MKRTAIIAMAALFAVGCGSPPSQRASSGSNAGTQNVGDAGGAPSGTGSMDGGSAAIPAQPNCNAYVSTATPLSTAWVDQQVASGQCSSNPPTVTVTNGAASASIFYAACTPVGTIPLACKLTAGMQTCSGGYWTGLCQSNSDCPAGTLCVSAAGIGDVPPTIHPQFGTCAKECSVAGSAQCGRCGLVCDTSTHVCTVPLGGPDGGGGLPDGG